MLRPSVQVPFVTLIAQLNKELQQKLRDLIVSDVSRDYLTLQHSCTLLRIRNPCWWRQLLPRQHLDNHDKCP